jgi:hypothetical protein
MYGLTITPEVAWNLIPWSWLVDWFSSAGSAIANLSGGTVDAVARYAYVMKSYDRRIEQHSEFADCNGAQYEATATWSAVAKQRTAAHPFGFGMTDDQLSSGQIAILAALGLTRV